MYLKRQLGSSAVMAPPPREISRRLAAQMLLGVRWAQTGWGTLFFMSMFFWPGGIHADLTDLRFDSSQFVKTTGEVLRCAKTRLVTIGPDRKTTFMYRNFYRFRTGGRFYESASYSDGVCAPPGTNIIEYLPDRPDISRIVGMRREAFPPEFALVFFLPLKGLFLITVGLVVGLSHLRLLRDGTAVAGELLEHKRTIMKGVHRLTFEFVDWDGKRRSLVQKTDNVLKFEVDFGYVVLYHAAKKGGARLMGTMPGAIDIDEGGQPQSRSWAFLILPVLATVANLLWMWHYL